VGRAPRDFLRKVPFGEDSDLACCLSAGNTLLEPPFEPKSKSARQIREGLPRAGTRSRCLKDLDNVVVHQGRLVGRSLPSAPSSAAERSLSRTPAGIAGTERAPLSMGIFRAGNRSGSGPAEQIRVAARRR